MGSGGVSCAEGPAHSLLVRSRRWPQPLANGLEHDVKRRDRENPDERCQYHAAEHRRADVAARQLRGAGGDDQRKKVKDEGEGRHHHGPEAQPRTFGGGFEQRDAAFPFFLRELDDQDAVLGREADENDHADLRVKIEREAADHDRGERPQHADGHGQQHRNGNILAKVPGIGLILIGEGDLSQELGFPRQYEHPQVLDAMSHIVKTCKKHKVAVGHPHVDSTNVERILGEGYSFLMAAPVRSFAALDKGRQLAKRG